MKCPDCGGPTKPLLTGMYCVNECDLPNEPPNLGVPCPHDETHYGTNGNATGTWCEHCGKLLFGNRILGSDDWLLLDDTEPG